MKLPTCHHSSAFHCILSAGSQDYDSLANYSLELNRSDPTECVNITIVDDADLEKSEQFLLVLNIGENTTLNFYQNLTSTAVVKIVDNGEWLRCMHVYMCT